MFGEMHSIKTESCTYVCALGITYEGTFHRGKKHGKGKKTWPTGEECKFLLHISLYQACSSN